MLSQTEQGVQNGLISKTAVFPETTIFFKNFVSV